MPLLPPPILTSHAIQAWTCPHGVYGSVSMYTCTCLCVACQALPGNMPLSAGIGAWVLVKYILSAYDSSQSLQPP